MFPSFSFSRNRNEQSAPLAKALRHLDARILADIGVEEGRIHRDLIDTVGRSVLQVMGVPMSKGR